jgi:hypothetical protein
MPRRRPTAVLLIAVLHFVFGGLGLLCTVCAGVMELTGTQQALANAGTPGQKHQAELQARRKEVSEQVHEERIPLYRAYSVTNRVFNTLFCVLLIASGAGLLRMQSWGRWLSVVYGVLSILANLAVFVYTIAFFMPADQEVFRRMPPQNDTEHMAYNIAMVVAPAGPCAMMVYPVAVLIVMLLPSVGAAFRPPKRRRRRGVLYDDEMRGDDDAGERYRVDSGGRD